MVGPQLCWLLSLEWVTNLEYVVQYLLNTCFSGVRFYIHIQPHTTQNSNMAAQLKKVTMKGLQTLQWQILYFPLVFTVTSKAHSLGHSIVLTKYITNSNSLLSFLIPLFLAFFLLQGFVLSPMGSLPWNWVLSTHAIQQSAWVFPLPLEM